MLPAQRTAFPASEDRGLDRGRPLSCTTESWPGLGDDIVAVRVVGEIDVNTSPALQAALDGAMDMSTSHVVIDAAGITFCCVRGFTLLATTALAAAAAGTGYAISGQPSYFERHTRILWADHDPIPRYRSVAAAVTAIRAEQAARHSQTSS